MRVFIDMSNPPPHDAPPALSLTLAGIFHGGGAVEAADEGISSGGRRRREETVEITSSENSSANGKSQSCNGIHDDDDENNDKIKRRKMNYNRHTPQQISVMEAMFKESPHPDEKQRKQLSKQLGLHPKQVKFWFQNRRTQVKAIQERQENSLLKSEIEKLRTESNALRNTNENLSCPGCGFSFPTMVAITSTKAQRLTVENSKLKAEVEKLKSIIVKQTSPNSSLGNRENGSSLDYHNVMGVVNQSMDELRKMVVCGEPLWMRSYETGREVLNYDEYLKAFCSENLNNMQKKSIEVSRESGVVCVDLKQLVQSFMDVNQWAELFPCLISKAATVDVISNGEGVYRDGAVQLMSAEIQMLTPMVATREMNFVRYCKQLGPNHWGIVDVSIDKVKDKMDASLLKCRKRPSGCIIEYQSAGSCKVTWVEHLECHRSRVHSLYLSIINSGLAFGAKHWISTLQQQCERILFLNATNVPTKDSSGVDTLVGRKSLLKLAQRMTRSFCRAIGASSYNSWIKFTTKTCEDIRLVSRNNLNDYGEPSGMILSAASSVWLPVSHHVLFDFLRNEKRRHEWDVMANGNLVQSTANLANGKDRKNAVTVLAMKNEAQDIWVIQDSSTNAFESMVVYAPIDINGLKSIMSGCDSSNTAVLASGFSILPDGIESRPSIISKTEMEMGGGSLLTIAFQIRISDSPTGKASKESIDSVNALISCTLQNIKKSLQCED